MGFPSDCKLSDDDSQTQPFFALQPRLKTRTLGLTSGRRFPDSCRDTAVKLSGMDKPLPERRAFEVMVRADITNLTGSLSRFVRRLTRFSLFVPSPAISSQAAIKPWGT